MDKYIAFLRGINVGGNKIVPMTPLKGTFEKLGFENVQTFLASGNVLFEVKKENLASLTKKISAALEKTFGFIIPLIIREVSEIEKIAKDNPFKGTFVTKDSRLYITFLSEEPKSTLKIPFVATDNSFRIIGIKERAVFTVLDLSKAGTLEVMQVLEKEFGKNITTRNWNTIEKILK